MDGLSDYERLKLELEEERRLREQTQKQLEQSEKQQENTTLHEYLHYCHLYLTVPMQVGSTDKSTQGTTTKVTGRCYPSKILPWDDFLESQEDQFARLQRIFGQERLFEPRSHTESVGKKACHQQLTSEDNLRTHQHLAIQMPIVDIFSARSQHLDWGDLNIGNGVIFENHENALKDSTQEVEKASQRLFKSLPKDQLCSFIYTGDSRRLAFIIEYKAPHKISVEEFRNALCKPNLCKEVIDRGTISNDAILKAQEKADTMAAKVLTQTFYYMLEKRLAYSYISTGEAFVFLRIKEDEEKTVYYHVIAREDASLPDVPDISDVHARRPSVFDTAVSQVACFCLTALQSERFGHEWQAKAIRHWPKWPGPTEDTGHDTDITDDGGKESLSQSFTASPPTSSRLYGTRSKSRARSTCGDIDMTGRPEEEESSDEDHLLPDSPSEASSTAAGASNKRRHPSTGSEDSAHKPEPSRSKHRTRQYCTQSCLLGLKRRRPLDETCPNVASHRKPASGAYHPFDVKTFARRVRQQLARTLDRDCESLDDKVGSRGALFKLTLTGYGYTFAAKGTVTVFVGALQHEARVYQRLNRLQGEVVPVHLGNIDLVNAYCQDIGVWIVHMMLMSWAGEDIETAGTPNLEQEAQRSWAEVRAEGVVHGDERYANLLWNAERRRAMVVDFDRSVLLPAKHKQVLRLAGKKRKRYAEVSPEYSRKRVFINKDEASPVTTQLRLGI